jgi:putative transposase
VNSRLASSSTIFLLSQERIRVVSQSEGTSVQYSSALLERLNRRQRAITDKCYIDETCVEARAQWWCLCQAIHSNADIVKLWFREPRNLIVVKRFLNKSLQRYARPERIVIYGSRANREIILSYDSRLRRVDRISYALNSIRLRQRRYLNNRIEQGYCVIKRRIRPMLGFKSIVFACAILGGVVTIYMSRKAQAN